MANHLLSGTAVGVSCGSTGSACVCRNAPINQPGNKTVSDVLIKSPVKQEGDFVTATAYFTTIYEKSPMVGTYSAVIRSLQSSSSLHVRDCGADMAGNTYTFTGNAGLYSDQAIPQLPEFNDDDLATIGIANVKALANLNSSLVNLPLLIAERKQTFSTIRKHGAFVAQKVSSARNSAEAMMRNTKTAAGRRAVGQAIANEHLALVFGLLPLIDEVKGAVEIFMSLDSEIMTARGRQAFTADTVEESTDFPDLPLTAVHFGRPWFDKTVRTHSRKSARTSISVSVDLRPAQGLRDWGFNPLAAVYDFIPLSFLVGWVSNLDTWVRSLDPAVGVTFLRGNMTTWRETVQHTELALHNVAHILPNGSGFTQTGELSGGDSMGRVLEVNRNRLDTYPIRSLHVYNNLSWGKAVTGLALAVQRFYKPLKGARIPRQFRYKGPRPKYLPNIKYTKY
jgi:hypothetical protein